MFFRTCGFLLFMVITACNHQPLIPSELAKDRDVRELFSLALDPRATPDRRYAAFESLIAEYRAVEAVDEINILLSRNMERYPDDPYGAYYLMALAENARDGGSITLARDYWRRLLKNSPDLSIRDHSLHLMAMRELAGTTDDPREAIALYEAMIRRYPNRVDLGRMHYTLALAYEKVGDWDGAYREYENFLSYPDSRIPGKADARQSVRKVLEFHKSNKTWVVEDLDRLVNNIKYAIRTLNASLLERYQADNFFLMNWSQEATDPFTHIPMRLGVFLKSSIRYGSALESFSNENEAYLWTQNWTYQIRTWYLYFRRIDYPADPEINGQWEWAGIYLGERL